MDQYKTCIKCKQILPIASFGLNKNYKDGRRTTCKDCRRIESASYRARYPEKKKAADKRNYELNGEAIRNRVKRYRVQNRQAVNDWHQKYRQTNKEAIAQVKLEWRRKNPHKFIESVNRRRLRKANAKTYTVTKKDARKILQKACIYCGDKSTQIEHIIPLCRGGTHGIGNLAGACERCNKSKGARFVMEWRLAKLTSQRLLNPSSNQPAKDR